MLGVDSGIQIASSLGLGSIRLNLTRRNVYPPRPVPYSGRRRPFRLARRSGTSGCPLHPHLATTEVLLSDATAGRLREIVSGRLEFSSPRLRPSPLFRCAIGMGTRQYSAALVISICSRFVSPSSMRGAGTLGSAPSARITSSATALASGGGTELPICRAPCHLVTCNRNQSGKPCSLAISRTVTQRGRS